MKYTEYGYTSSENTHSHSYILNPIFESLDKKQNKLIIDIGCGNGSLANDLIELGYDVYGIDASEDGIRIAQKKHPSRFFVNDISNGDLPEQLREIRFDTIISTEVIEHLYDPESFILFCKKILTINGNGTLILTTPYHGYLKNILLAVFNKFDFHHTVHWVGGHIKFFSKKTLTELLNKSGFRVSKFVGCGRFPFLWKSMLLKAEINI